MSTSQTNKAWVVSADMGYGHQRAVHPLRNFAFEEIITLGKSDQSDNREKKQWKNILNTYETFSRASDIPIVGRMILSIMGIILEIPPLYSNRDLTESTLQVEYLLGRIRNGICSGLGKKIESKKLPFITSFYAPAIYANSIGYENIYCIICDVDINRVWVPKIPEENKINYLVPCEQTATRLKRFGIKDENIFITGFPLPLELLGESLSILKNNLYKRLMRLDPNRKFFNRNSPNVTHYLGKTSSEEIDTKPITISFVVGGAGAQKEIAKQIVESLNNKLVDGTYRINLIAGIRPEVIAYFEEIKSQKQCADIKVIKGGNLDEYFINFNNVLHDTDILWTKPSELVFYSALGIPIILTPEIGSQEIQNKNWILKMNAGIQQLSPDFTKEWLPDLINEGTLADKGWAGFLSGRKLGTQRIIDLIFNQKFELSKKNIEI